MNKEWKIRLLIFIVTAIIFTCGTIYAETKINADKVTYNETTTVKDKLDTLYTKVKPNYTGDTTITPTEQ